MGILDCDVVVCGECVWICCGGECVVDDVVGSRRGDDDARVCGDDGADGD